MKFPLPSKIAINRKTDEEIPYVAISAPQNENQTDNESGKNFFSDLFKNLASFFFDFLETIVVALSIFVVVYLFFVQPHEVNGSSMEPNFHNKEYILTDKISFRFHDPKRGEVIIFKSPTNPDTDYIKRIIGLPGDRVKIENGFVYINDIKLDESYLDDLTYLSPNSMLQNGIDITIPDYDYFVMGDNRPNSSDSREFGPIPKNSIIGKAFIRYWPIQESGLVKEVNYRI